MWFWTDRIYGIQVYFVKLVCWCLSLCSPVFAGSYIYWAIPLFLFLDLERPTWLCLCITLWIWLLALDRLLFFLLLLLLYFTFACQTTLKPSLFCLINIFLDCVSSACSVCIRVLNIFLKFLAEMYSNTLRIILWKSAECCTIETKDEQNFPLQTFVNHEAVCHLFQYP